MAEIDPALFDPRHQERYQALLTNETLRHEEALALIALDAPDRQLSMSLLAPGEDLLTSQLEERALAYYSLLTEALYRRSMPTLSPDINAPAAMRTADTPFAVLTRGFGSPRIQNPRLVAMSVESNFPAAQLKSPEIQLGNMACVGLVVDMKYGGVPLEGTVLGRMHVRESAGRKFYAVSNTFSRTPETTKKLKDIKERAKNQGSLQVEQNADDDYFDDEYCY